MASQASQSSLVEDAISEFKISLRPKRLAAFRKVSLWGLKRSIGSLQSRQDEKRQLRDLSRMQPFLDAIEQLGDMTKTISHDTDIFTLFWGPTEFLLLETAKHDTALCELLKLYRLMGESLPHLLQYRPLFQVQPHLGDVLSNIYKTTLNFQLDLLRYFEQEEWTATFSETWGTRRDHTSSKISDIAQYRSLIESESTSVQVRDTQHVIQQSRQVEDDMVNEQDLQRLREVSNWLNAATVRCDHDKNVSARVNNPESGRWLLEHTTFADWFNPKFPAIPPLLWINGIPGAGKSVLASFIIDEARSLKPAPTVLYFYCKEGDSNQDNFGAICRTLLFQMLEQDTLLLNTLYQECCRSGQKVLSSETLTKKLLSAAFRSCKSAYIILDGLDECPREEQKRIITWFRQLVEDLPTTEPERLRCLFVSRDDGRIRSLCDGLESINIRSENTKSDIEKYNQTEANLLKNDYPSLPMEKINGIAEKVSNIAEGQFLLVRLIWKNLNDHASSIARLEEELAPGVFPETINDAYRRIMVRINQELPGSAKNDILRLLGWIVCAKRPLKWHEVQGMNSIDLDERRVDIERRRFFRSPSELCGSLIEKRSDDTVDLVHLTAKFFLLHDRYVDAPTQELQLATLCIDYLNLPVCIAAPTNVRILNGDYAFLDYAVIHWLHHLEAGVTLLRKEREQLMEHRDMEQLAESLEVFVGHHWNSPGVSLSLANSKKEKINCFSGLPFYPQFEQAVASTKRQLKYFGRNLKKEEIALDLSDLVANFRAELERLIMEYVDPMGKEIFHEKYGRNLFKCPRFSCEYFNTGFSSAPERDRHVNRHERPFRCSYENCPSYIWGFSHKDKLEKHLKNNHFIVQETRAGDDEFPTDEDMQRSIVINQPGDNETQTPEAIDDNSISDPEIELPLVPPQKRQRQPQTEFICEDCGKVFKRKYNLKSHLQTHNVEGSYVCEHCNLRFKRENDLNRHYKRHTGERQHKCHGCGKSYARADTLRQHWESRVGQACSRLQHQQTNK
ncbi:putative zinc finger protein [Xylaria arbuscula]|nr:putative zinc finger protein [Xylaria arbuscula]